MSWPVIVHVARERPFASSVQALAASATATAAPNVIAWALGFGWYPPASVIGPRIRPPRVPWGAARTYYGRWNRSCRGAPARDQESEPERRQKTGSAAPQHRTHGQLRDGVTSGEDDPIARDQRIDPRAGTGAHRAVGEREQGDVGSAPFVILCREADARQQPEPGAGCQSPLRAVGERIRTALADGVDVALEKAPAGPRHRERKRRGGELGDGSPHLLAGPVEHAHRIPRLDQHSELLERARQLLCFTTADEEREEESRTHDARRCSMAHWRTPSVPRSALPEGAYRGVPAGVLTEP